jgi:hypothetical protein
MCGKVLVSLALAGMLVGCATVTEPVVIESDFGNSVEQMAAAQFYDPQAALNPSLEPVKGTDGSLGQNVMSRYRYVPNPADVLRSQVTFKKE